MEGVNMTLIGEKTPLYEAHIALGAMMMDYAGWQLPRQYTGQRVHDEVEAVRNRIGMFDVSHMATIKVYGSKALSFLENLVTRSLDMPIGVARYALILDDDGKILDDCIVMRPSSDYFSVVVNAANAQKVLAWMREKNRSVMIIDTSRSKALIALQGPRAYELLSTLAATGDLPERPFTLVEQVRIGTSCVGDPSIFPVTVSRTGYTGEDGFELLVEKERATILWQLLFREGKDFGLLPCGLLARDILRLEAGMPLYGNELTKDPFAEDLGRYCDMTKNFIGKSAIEKFAATPTAQVRTGFFIEGVSLHKKHTVCNMVGQTIGSITSSCLSPTLGKKKIAMGYIPREYVREGAPVLFSVNGQYIQGKITLLPFYKRKK